MPTAVLERGSRKVDRKVLSISSKRQITIPQKFYQTLGFGNEAECIVHGNELMKMFSDRRMSNAVSTI